MASIGMSGTASSSRIRAMLLAGRAGQQAIVADAVEALWQDVHQETTDELVGIERHGFVSVGAFDPIILPLEGDAVVVEGDQAAVGDGDGERMNSASEGVTGFESATFQSQGFAIIRAKIAMTPAKAGQPRMNQARNRRWYCTGRDVPASRAAAARSRILIWIATTGSQHDPTIR